MTIRDDRREAAIERMADHVLSEGLGAATLRPLAAAAGTSDRMLLYYFADKDDLLTATLARIAARMTAQLDGAIPDGPRRPFAVLLEQVWAAMASKRLQPFMPLWLELASGAARGLQTHRDVAGEIVAAINVSAVTILTREGELHGVLKTEILKAAEALSRDLGADRNQAAHDKA